MDKKESGKLPAWTLLIPAVGWLGAFAFIEACREFGLSLWIGVPASIAIVVIAAIVERLVERRLAS
ncbi:TPA: hypothetical protein ACK3Q6_008059 [Burkholderia cepacia]